MGSMDSRPEEQATERLLAISSTFEYIPSQDSNPGQLIYLNGQNLMAQAFDEKRLKPVGEPLLIAEQVDSFSASYVGILAYSTERSTMGAIASEELAWMDREGRRLESAAPPGQYNNFRLSMDDEKIVFDSDNPGPDPDIWVRDLARGVSARVTFDPNTDNLPIWSFDRLRVLFPSWRDGIFNLYLKAASGTGQAELLVELGTPTGWGTDWSKDGNFIMYQIPGDDTGQDLWIAPQSDPQEPYPYLNENYDEQDGTFSPDSKWIAYVSNETGRNEIYVQSFPRSDSKFRISNSGGSEPYWSRNGTELFYVSADRYLMSVQIKLSPMFDYGRPKPLMPIPLVAGKHSYAVSSDGKRFLVANRTGEETVLPVAVLVNWQTELKK